MLLKNPGSQQKRERIATHSPAKMSVMTNIAELALHSINGIKQISDPKNIGGNGNYKNRPSIISGLNKIAEYKIPITAPLAPTAVYPSSFL